MSAFIGIVQFNGEPVDRPLLENLTRYLGRIGPDAQNVRVNGSVGLGNALLKTNPEAEYEKQPLSFDDRTIIVGDVRLDARETLYNSLSPAPKTDLQSTPDIELVFHAWRQWGEQLCDHLLGDFSFAIWNAAKQQLFTARDPFGIRSLYYHLTADRLVFSNALNALLHFPGMDKTLNDQAVGDFLLFRHNTDTSTTSFRDIQQLRPAHQAMFTAGKKHERQYWALPMEEPLRYKRDEEYLERFNELFEQAVSSRLRCPAVNIMISGGMDSTSITAKALSHYASTGDPGKIYLLTLRATSAPDESEHHMAKRLADEFGLELKIISPGGSTEIPVGGKSDWPSPEVHWYTWQKILQSSFSDMAEKAPVVLTGQGGDSVFCNEPSRLPSLFRQGKFFRYVREFRAWRRMHGARPPLGIRTLIQQKFEPKELPGVPAWFNPDFVKNQNLDEKLIQFLNRANLEQAEAHPFRPKAYHQICSPYWQYVLPGYDSQVTGQPLEFRHPFFDIRLIQFLLRVDSPRWFHRKTLLRQTMRRQLPDYIGSRPKHAFDYKLRREALLTMEKAQWDHHRSVVNDLEAFVNMEQYARMSQSLRSLPAIEADQLIVPIHLANWKGEISRGE